MRRRTSLRPRRSPSPRQRRRRWSSSSPSEAKSDKRIGSRLEGRLEELDKFKEKTKKKEKDKFKWSKPGCEKQFDFNIEVKEIVGDKLRVELKKHFKEKIPDKAEEIVKEGEVMIDDQNHKLKIADEFGF